MSGHNIVSLDDRRNQGGPLLACPFCTCVWLVPQGINIDAITLSPTGYAYPLVCNECGATNDGHRWARGR